VQTDNQPVRPPVNGDAKKNQPPKPKTPGPNNPFREALLSFNGKRVIVLTAEGAEVRGNFHCFDLSGSRCLAIDVDDQGPTILSHYRSIHLETAK